MGLWHLYSDDSGLYRDHHSLYFDDWRHYQRPRRTVKRQRLSFCDDQDCRFPGDYRRTDACRLAGAGQQGAGLPVFDGADGGDGRLAVYLLFSYHA